MRIGILGSGLMGGKLGTIFAKAGHDVVFSYARCQRKLNRLARQAGRRAAAGTPREAAEDADVLLLAVHWSRVNDVLKQAGDLAGKVLITCSMPMNASDTALVIAHTSSGAEALAKWAALASGHSVVASGRDRERVSRVLGTSSDLLAVTLDVTNTSDTDAAVRVAVDRFGRIDVLVNNAASFYAGYFEELTQRQIDQQLAASLSWNAM
jgi:predicted dinucleotide-binding enzyme